MSRGRGNRSARVEGRFVGRMAGHFLVLPFVFIVWYHVLLLRLLMLVILQHGVGGLGVIGGEEEGRGGGPILCSVDYVDYFVYYSMLRMVRFGWISWVVLAFFAKDCASRQWSLMNRVIMRRWMLSPFLSH